MNIYCATWPWATGMRYIALFLSVIAGSCQNREEVRDMVIRDDSGRIRLAIGREMRVPGGSDTALDRIGIFIYDETGATRVSVTESAIWMSGRGDGEGWIWIKVGEEGVLGSTATITMSVVSAVSSERRRVTIRASPEAPAIEVIGPNERIVFMIPE